MKTHRMEDFSFPKQITNHHPTQMRLDFHVKMLLNHAEVAQQFAELKH
jgi:hypothetical protein